MLSNTPPPSPDALREHFSATYFSLRLGLATLAFVFPVFLYLWAKLVHGLPLQPSMSAYFFAADATHCADFPMRTFFVGFLFAIGAALYAYKGLTDLENGLLNVAAVCAACVAVFPERIDPTEAAVDTRIRQLFADCPAVEAWAGQPQTLPYHYIAAGLLFAVLAVVAWGCACKSLQYLPAGSRRDAVWFRNVYRSIAVLVVLCPVTGFVLSQFLARGGNFPFFMEMAGIWTFGAYWAVKTYELSLSRLEESPAVAQQNLDPGLRRQRAVDS